VTENKEIENPNITLTITLQEVNVIAGALQELPYKVADPVLRRIVSQTQEQVKAIKQFNDNQSEEN